MVTTEFLLLLLQSAFWSCIFVVASVEERTKQKKRTREEKIFILLIVLPFQGQCYISFAPNLYNLDDQCRGFVVVVLSRAACC